MEVIKVEVERHLGVVISDDLFKEALEYARHKQEYIYQQSRRTEVLESWYLVALTKECVRSLAFSKLTMDLCSRLRNMEKEHSASCQSAPTDIHIVTVSAL